MDFCKIGKRDITFITLEYRIKMQQILFKFWLLAHLHAYFVLHNSTEKTWCRIWFLPPIYYLHAYLVYTFISYLRVERWEYLKTMFIRNRKKKIRQISMILDFESQILTIFCSLNVFTRYNNFLWVCCPWLKFGKKSC